MEYVIQVITVYALPLIFAITLHEAAHGYVARYFGDNTAWMLGRVTLNPVKHIDPIGTILVPLAMLLMSSVSDLGGIIFGWAKPVPVNFRLLRNPKRSSVWIAVAGPASNLFQACLWLFLLKICFSLGIQERFVFEVCSAGIKINLIFMALNLIPIPPLDGGRILIGLLPNGLAWQYSRIEPYGMWILIALIMTGMLSWIMRPFLQFGIWVVNFFL